MIISTAVILFLLWLLDVFGLYRIGWPIHILLIISLILFFIRGVRNRKPRVSQLMEDYELHESEAEEVRKVMDKYGLGGKEAFELYINMKTHQKK